MIIVTFFKDNCWYQVCILCKTTLSEQKSVRFYLLSVSINYQTFTHDTKHMALPSVVYNSFILSTRLQQGNKIKSALSHLAFLKVRQNCVLHFQKELKTILATFQLFKTLHTNAADTTSPFNYIISCNTDLDIISTNFTADLYTPGAPFF